MYTHNTYLLTIDETWNHITILNEIQNWSQESKNWT